MPLARLPLAVFLLLGMALTTGCDGGGDADTWIYWLADPNPVAIGDAAGSAVVVDYCEWGDDASAFSAEDVATMGRDGERPVLAYLSIGEAEDYRYYWDPEWDDDGDGEPDPGAPTWLGPSNPEWEGNYKVRYWDPEWQEVLLGDGGYLARIEEAGFDGVYLDIIDAYYYWAEEAPELEDLPIEETAGQMIALIEAIGDHGRGADSGFLVFPQNGEFVGYDAADESGMERLLGAIDGFGVEDVFFPGDADEDNPWAPDGDRLDLLDEVVEAGKTVLSVEYLTDTTAADRYQGKASGHGFSVCIADRDLASLPRIP